MARAHLKYLVRDRAGNAIQNALVTFYRKGTGPAGMGGSGALTTPTGSVYAAETGGSALPDWAFETNSQGEVEAWAENPQSLDAWVTDNSDTAYYPSSSTKKITFTAFGERVEVHLPPEDEPGGGLTLVGLTDVDDATVPTAGHFLRGDGTDWSNSAIQDADLPSTIARDSEVAAVQSDVDAHEARTDNPHAVTKSQVGLANADNTSDANKPVSTAQQAALDLKQSTSEKGQASGYASLDGGGKVPAAQLPNSVMDYKGIWNATTNSPSLADGTGSAGDVYRVTVAGSQNLGSGSISFEVGDYVIYNGSTWEKSDTTDSVPTVFGRTGNVTAQSGDYTKAQVGLGNVDNTSDADKPVSTATQTALDAKQALSEKDTDGGYVGRDADGDVGTESTNGADTASFTFEAANEPGSGLRGFKLDRSGFGNPLGFTLRSAGVPEWDVMALDNFTNDLIFVYEHGIGDQLRYGEGAHMLFGRSVISPADTYRFRIESSAADDAAMVDLLVLNGSTASSGGNMTHLLRAENATETVFSVMAAGRVGVGVLNPTQRFQVSQSQDATTQFLLSNSNGGSSAKISLRVQGEAKSVFLEVPSSTWGTASLRNVGYLYTNDTHLVFGTNSTERARIDNLGNMVFGVGALAAGATDGFPYIPTIPGAPTGTPTAKTGLAPIVIDTTNHKLSWHENGKWWSNQPAAICIFPNGGSVTATDMAAALTEMVAGSPRGRMKYDFTRAQQVRLTLMVTTVGSASAEVRAQYSTDSGGSWNYLDGGTGPSVGIASTTGVKDSGWVDLAAGAKGDVWLRLISINGDGAADPSFGLGHIHVR